MHYTSIHWLHCFSAFKSKLSPYTNTHAHHHQGNHKYLPEKKYNLRAWVQINVSGPICWIEQKTSRAPTSMFHNI
jgi:hypothetical protein